MASSDYGDWKRWRRTGEIDRARARHDDDHDGVVPRDDRIVSTTGEDGFARIWDADTASALRDRADAPLPKIVLVFGRLATRTHDGAAKSELLVLAPLSASVGATTATPAELASFQLGVRPQRRSLGRRHARGHRGLDNAVKVIDVITGKLRFDLVATPTWSEMRVSAYGTRVRRQPDRTAKCGTVDVGTSRRDRITATWCVLSRFSPDGKRFFTVSP